MIPKKYLSKNQHFVPGIYGGLGPMAHIKFEEALIRECNRRGIKTDQECPVWFLVNGSSTPDRTKSLQKDGQALNHLIYFAKHLERQGADFIVMTCNTAHAYKNDIEKQIHIPVISMIKETASYIYQKYTLKKIGVLATDGTLKTGLYKNALSNFGIEAVAPPIGSDIQNLVMKAIYDPVYGIKSSGTDISVKALNNIKSAVAWSKRMGCRAIIAGCTEISLGLKNSMFDQETVIDPMNVLASRVIDLTFSETLTEESHKKVKTPTAKVIYQNYGVITQ